MNEGGDEMNKDDADSSDAESVINSLDHIIDDDELIEVRQKIQRLKSNDNDTKVNQTQSQTKSQTQTQSQTQFVYGNKGHMSDEELVGSLGSEGSEIDYPESFNYDSPYSSDNESKRRKPLYPIYSPKIDISKSLPVLGMRFRSHK
ncbi:hypothetical protein LguiB_029678 [Lonicera macranthoides]